MPAPAHRLSNIRPYPFATLGQRISEAEAAGHDVIRLDVGSPDQPPPDAVIQVLTEVAQRPDCHGYAGYRGTPEFRAAVADYYQRRFGVILDPATEVLPLLGSKEGIVNLSTAYVGSGDLALVSDVSYPSYTMGAHLNSADVFVMASPASNGYQPDFSTIPGGVRAKAKLLWVNFPNNPTGAVADIAFYQQAVDFCAANDILLASDNPYVEVTYDGYTAGSVLQADGAKAHAVELISFSKTYNMAGWRLGAIVGHADVLKNLLKVKSNLDTGHFHAVYQAGIKALTTPQSWIDWRNKLYQDRRDRIMAALPAIGLSGATPAGAMYVWAKVADGDGAAYAERAFTDAHVSIAPGTFYGPGGDAYVRFSLGTGDDLLDRALQRLKDWYGA